MRGIPLRRLGLGALTAGALAFPYLSDNPYLLSVVISALIIAIAVYGLNILVGFTGLLSLAHAGFFGIGAYAAGILTTTHGFSFWLALPLAVAFTAAAGFLVGMVALRTRADYFAIFTLAVGVMITLVIDHWESLTGGTDGIIGVPPPTPIGPLRFDSLTAQYYLFLGFLVLTVVAVWNLARSLVGRTLLAVRNDEQLARAIGIDVGRVQRSSFAVSSAFAGLAGALYAAFLGYLGPSLSGLVMTFNMLLYLMIGGVASLSGPLVGTLLLIAVTQGLLAFEDYQLLILGPLLVLSVIFFPLGLAGLGHSLRQRLRYRGPSRPPGRRPEGERPPHPRTEHGHAVTRAESGD